MGYLDHNPPRWSNIIGEWSADWLDKSLRAQNQSIRRKNLNMLQMMDKTSNRLGTEPPFKLCDKISISSDINGFQTIKDCDAKNISSV